MSAPYYDWQIIPYAPQFESEVIFIKQEIQKEYNQPIFTADSLAMNRISQLRGHHYWLLQVDTRIVGTVGAIQLNCTQAELKRFYLLKNYRGLPHKFAQQLLDKVLSHCRAHDFSEIYLGTMEILKAANAFYLKNGFERLGKAQLPGEKELDPMDDVFYWRKV